MLAKPLSRSGISKNRIPWEQAIAKGIKYKRKLNGSRAGVSLLIGSASCPLCLALAAVADIGFGRLRNAIKPVKINSQPRLWKVPENPALATMKAPAAGDKTEARVWITP